VVFKKRFPVCVCPVFVTKLLQFVFENNPQFYLVLVSLFPQPAFVSQPSPSYQ